MVYFSIYLYNFFISFIVSIYRSFVSLGRFIPKYFILFIAMVNGIVSLVSLYIFSLLVYKYAREFCILIFYPATLLYALIQFSQFICSVMSDSLWPHELQQARPPCPSLTPRVHSDSGPSSWWGHPAISSSVVPFSSLPQSFPASESFPMSQLFAWGGQSTGVSALASFSITLFFT